MPKQPLHITIAIATTGRREQLTRTPRAPPRLKLAPFASLFDVKAEDIAFEGYDPWPAIKAPVAV